MERKLLYTFITAILLVPLYGVQAMAQNYKLPNNSGTITMSDILKENPSLKGKKIYGDIKRDDNGNPSDPADLYGGVDSKGNSILNNDDRYGSDNPDIDFKKDDIDGLTLISKKDQPIEKAILYLAEYKTDKGWCKSDTSIIFERQDSAANLNTPPEDTGDTTEVGVPPDDPDPNPEPYPWWTWLLCSFLSGIVLSFIISKSFVSKTNKITDEDNQARNVVKQPTFEEKGLTKGEVDQIVSRIAEKYSSELFAKISTLVDEKGNSPGSEKRTQNNTTLNVPVKETRKVKRVETEEFCGYAQLPQNGDFALTLTQDPARTAFVISRRGSDYLVGLIDDEQTLSQLVQPLNDLKANGSNIVDFPEGELQGAQKIVCVDRGIFKEESTGRIIPVKPIQIKRG